MMTEIRQSPYPVSGQLEPQPPSHDNSGWTPRLGNESPFPPSSRLTTFPFESTASINACATFSSSTTTGRLHTSLIALFLSRGLRNLPHAATGEPLQDDFLADLGEESFWLYFVKSRSSSANEGRTERGEGLGSRLALQIWPSGMSNE